MSHVSRVGQVHQAMQSRASQALAQHAACIRAIKQGPSNLASAQVAALLNAVSNKSCDVPLRSIKSVMSTIWRFLQKCISVEMSAACAFIVGCLKDIPGYSRMVDSIDLCSITNWFSSQCPSGLASLSSLASKMASPAAAAVIVELIRTCYHAFMACKLGPGTQAGAKDMDALKGIWSLDNLLQHAGALLAAGMAASMGACMLLVLIIQVATAQLVGNFLIQKNRHGYVGLWCWVWSKVWGAPADAPTAWVNANGQPLSQEDIWSEPNLEDLMCPISLELPTKFCFSVYGRCYDADILHRYLESSQVDDIRRPLGPVHVFKWPEAEALVEQIAAERGWTKVPVDFEN